MKAIFILIFLAAASLQQGFAQTDSSQMQPATDQVQPQNDQTQTQQTDEYSNQNTNSLDVQPESVQMAEPSGTGYVSSPGHYAGNRTETIRYYSGSHNGNNVTKTVEVPVPDESTTQSPY